MSALADQLFASAQAMQNEVQVLQLGGPDSAGAASLVSQAVAYYLMAATQDNAHNASASLLGVAATATKLETITKTIAAQSARLAAQIEKAQTLISIGTNLVTIVAGAANPLAVLPTINAVIGQLSS